MPITEFSEVHPFIQVTVRVDTDGTDMMVIADPSHTRYRVDHIIVRSTDAVDFEFKLVLNHESGQQPIGECTVPARAGCDGTPGLDILPLVLPATVSGLAMTSGCSLYGEPSAALSAGAVMSIVAIGGLI
jgi:hypothetical protein